MPTLRLNRGMSMDAIVDAIITLRSQVRTQCDDVVVDYGTLGGGRVTMDAGNVLSAVAKAMDPSNGRSAFNDVVREMSMLGVDLRDMDRAIEVDQFRPNLPPITNCRDGSGLVA